MHLVTRCHFRSIRHIRKPYAARKLYGYRCAIETELLPIEVLHCENTKFSTSCAPATLT